MGGALIGGSEWSARDSALVCGGAGWAGISDVRDGDLGRGMVGRILAWVGGIDLVPDHGGDYGKKEEAETSEREEVSAAEGAIEEPEQASSGEEAEGLSEAGGVGGG